MRDQRGQTAAEYLGMLVIVAVLVLGFSQTKVGEAVGAGVKTQICKIAGGEDCGETATPPPGATPGPGDGPTSGPPLANAPDDFPVLPFPGSVSVTCSGQKGKAEQDCKAKKGAKAEAGVRGKYTISRSPDKLNPAGCPVTTLGVSAAVEAYGKAKVKGKEAGAGVEVYGGASQNYDVTVTPDRADAIAGGEDPPNPLDPTTLGTGEGLELSDKYYAGLKLDASYKAMQASMGFDKGRKLSSGVKRIDDKTVRVYVGDSQYVKNALTVGVGGDIGKLYLGNDTELSNGKLRAVDIDITTPEGWAAYQSFAQTGTVPDAGAAGTTNPTTSDTIDYTSKSKVGGSLKGVFDASVDLGSSEGHRTETRNSDGTTTTYADARYNDVGLQVIKTRAADGSVVGTPTYGLNVNHVDETVLKNFQEVNGMPVTGGTTARLQFSEGDLTRIQDQAIAQIQQRFKDMRRDPPSREHILETYKGNPYAVLDGVALSDPLLNGLAAAQSPEDVLIALYHAGMSNGSGNIDALMRFAINADMAANDGEPSRVQPLPSESRFPGQQYQPDCG